MGGLQIAVDGRSVMVRDMGDPQGAPVVYFHGTHGSRLDVDFGADLAQRVGVRVIAFDRPGYGRSDPASCSLELVARDVEAIVDRLGVGRFATLGWSGGGPFALVTAATLADRVTQVGVSGGLAPADQMPGAQDALNENDLLALSYLPAEPTRAAQQFLAVNEELTTAMMSVKDDEQAPWIDWMWGASDPDVVADQAARRTLSASFGEALRQGPMAIAWDNVAFVGPWGVDLSKVACPVHLWFGDQDQMAPPANGEWFVKHLSNDLVIHRGEGHLLPFRHWDEMLRTLTTIR